MSKSKNIFFEGPISPDFIAQSILKHNQQTAIGAHSIFLGQVRKDQIEGKPVTSILYSAHEELATPLMQSIREEIFEKYELSCMHVYQSLGEVLAGEICLFVFTSAPHRRDAIEACQETVERVKAELPVWGKELMGDGSHHWKENV